MLCACGSRVGARSRVHFLMARVASGKGKVRVVREGGHRVLGVFEIGLTKFGRHGPTFGRCWPTRDQNGHTLGNFWTT